MVHDGHAFLYVENDENVGARDFVVILFNIICLKLNWILRIGKIGWDKLIHNIMIHYDTEPEGRSRSRRLYKV